jgi:Domain of unknown function (DUF1707)
MSDPGQIRVSDAERERLVEELHEHTVAGRLTAEEYEQRLESVYAARTRAELDVLRADLPVSSLAAQLAVVERKSKLRRRLVHEASGSLTLSLICVGVWIVAGASGAFWPIWVILFTLLPALRDGFMLLGPGSDIDVVEARLQARHERNLARWPIDDPVDRRSVRRSRRRRMWP